MSVGYRIHKADDVECFSFGTLAVHCLSLASNTLEICFVKLI